MQTNFTETQLKDRDNQSSEKIFKKCVHCGMCNATCPTYGILGDELDGPRGRIYLIKDMLENNKKPTEKVVKHIDRCLSCYSCMTTCPAGVNYMHLIDHGKKYIEKNYERSTFDKLIRYFLSITLPNTKVFRLSSFLVTLSKPFKFLMPSKIKDMIDLMPSNFPKKNLPIKEIYKASGKKKVARVALLTGCVQKEISPQINEATIRLLNRHGVEVVVPKKIRCCGSLNHHLGKEEDAHQDFKNNNSNEKEAIFAFNGDVYDGIDANTINESNHEKLQDSLRILSGLYEILKPFDKIKAYRLEMGTKISINGSKNLYEFWKENVTTSLLEEINEDDFIVNLASNEYFSVIDRTIIPNTIVSPQFKDFKNGKLKIISFYAKKARGLMTRYLIDNNIKTISDIEGFNSSGYMFSQDETSNPLEPVFVR